MLRLSFSLVQWKVAPLDELLAKLRDYFGKDNIHIEYQVKSKAAKAAEPVRPQPVASPPVDMTIDDALIHTKAKFLNIRNFWKSYEFV